MNLPRRLALVCVTTLALGALGSGCRRDRDDDAKDGKDGKGIPTNAVSVSTPTVGLPTGGKPVQIPPGIPPVGTPASFAPLAKATAPAVVTVLLKIKKGHMIGKGIGSGFLIDKSGTILTNNHVVQDASDLAVQLYNDKRVDAKVLGTDPMTDVAVIKIDPPAGIEPIALGDSDAVSVGDWLVAIGSPHGLRQTVTAGILSARGRTINEVPLPGQHYFDFLQTDTAINQGNSGGPLLNLKGEVIGINTAINAKAQGLAFAIPINMVKQMLPSLVKDGRVVRSYLGVGIEDSEFDEKLGTKGALVVSVKKGTPAAKAGIKVDDVILAVDGTPVKNSSQMRWLVSIAGVGRKVTLRVVRDSKAFDLTVKLEKLPEQKPAPAKPSEEEEEEEEDPH